MPTEKAIWDESFKAGSDLSAKQHFCVEITGADQVDLVNAATDRAIGVLQNKPAASQAAEVRLLGITKAVSDGSVTAIAAGDYVGPNATGKVIKKATADNIVMGIALEASSADGTVISVLMVPVGFFRTAA